MKRLSYYLPFLLPTILFLFAACENELPYNEKNKTPQLTMNAFIYTDSMHNTLYLSFTGKYQTERADNTVVDVYVNDEMKETIHPTVEETTKNHTTFRLNTKFNPGDKVRIEAHTTDYKYHAWVEEIVPYPVQIQQVDTGNINKPPQPFYNPFKQLRILVHFNDPPGEKNYYRIIIEQQETVKGINSLGEKVSKLEKSYNFWPWDDIALTDGRPATSEELETELIERITNKYGVFDDSWFRDKRYTLNIQTALMNRYYSINFMPQYLDIDIVVRLLSITESEYYYISTLNMLDSDILDDYINDPIRIPGNVHGGNGFVGISSENGKTIQVIRNKKIEYYD